VLIDEVYVEETGPAPARQHGKFTVTGPAD
jgi:hypothetical protein